jgi:hypothetical protein
LNIPKIKVGVKPLEEDVDLTSRFLFPRGGEWDWSEIVYQNYPELKAGVQGVEGFPQKKARAEDVLREIAIQDKGIMLKKAADFQGEWVKINDPVMEALSEIVELKWPQGHEIIKTRISLNPICSRFIESKIFDLFYAMKLQEMQSFAIHEISHFIYFEKWKQVFPETSQEEFDEPHLIWKLSEMVPGIILNDKRIQEVFKWQFRSYQEFEELKIEGKFLLEYLRDFYQKREGFEDFLKKSYQFVLEHQKTINIHE